MQKKIVNKILIGAVALIWGVVLYKFSVPFFAVDTPVITSDVLVKPSELLAMKKDTFRLTVPERDPFLGTIARKKQIKPVTSIKKQAKTNTVKTVSNITWPRVQFLGYVKSGSSKLKLGLVRVNGTLKRVRKGDEVSELKVISISDAEITMNFNGENKNFKKN